MKAKYAVAFVIVIIFGSIFASVYSKKKEQSYNYTRALEELNKGNNDDALDYLQKEVKENPDNGVAYLAIGILQRDSCMYSDAMESINMAIRKISGKDKTNKSLAFATRANLYCWLSDTVRALEDFSRALKTDPENTDVMESYGQLLYELNLYADADEVYRKIQRLNPADVIGYMGLGRNAFERGDYEAAIGEYNKLIKIYDDYSQVFSFRAECYMKLGKYVEAADDIMKALSIDYDFSARMLLATFPDDQMPLLIAKLKGMAVKHPYDASWSYMVAGICRERGMYRDEIEALKNAYDIDASPVFLYYMAQAYSELGEYAEAIEAINEAMKEVPDNTDYLAVSADILGESGDIEGALKAWGEYIEKNPDYYGGYYRRGFFEDNSGRTDEALEDYNMSIILYPDFAYSYLGKGDMLTRKGRTEEAAEAYRKVVELDTIPNNNSCAMYAMYALGEKDRAVDFMERTIASDSDDKGIYYDGACFYSRLGDLDKALANLRKSLENGFRRFHQIMTDDDLVELRATEGFKALMDEYSEKQKAAAPDTTAKGESSKIVEIPFTPSEGCMSVKCSVNDLPLSFIFDTGASVVSLSQVEANFMLKNGYLKKGDFVGSGRFVDAQGDIYEGAVVNLGTVEIGGLKIRNVKATIVSNQKAPLLLGQTVLARLGSIEIDNADKKLIIKVKK